MNISGLFTAVALGALIALPAWAQQVKTVAGVVINLGLMSAEQAIHAEGHRDAHPSNFPSGSSKPGASVVAIPYIALPKASDSP